MAKIRSSMFLPALLGLTGCTVAPQFGGPFVPKAFTGAPTVPNSFMNVSLSAEQHAAIQDAIADLLSDGATVGEINGYKMFDGDNLRAVVYSTPINDRGSAYDVDTIGCSFYDKDYRSHNASNPQPAWHCFYSDKLSNVYVASLKKTLRLGAGVSEQDALAIFKDALATCDLDFDVPYSQKPRLLLSSTKGYMRFSAPKCHFEYRMRKGLAIRGKPFDTDTIPGNT